MQTYEITHIIENEEWERKLTELAQRCRKLNGWTEKELLQFAMCYLIGLHRVFSLSEVCIYILFNYIVYVLFLSIP